MGWLGRTLRLPSGLIADHEDGGRVDATVWSYNQGSTLGAQALLHRAKGGPEDLDDARALARVSLEHFRGEVLWTHPPVFNAVWFRNLLDLERDRAGTRSRRRARRLPRPRVARGT